MMNDLECLNNLAAKVRRSIVTFRGGRYYLVALTPQGGREALASFTDSAELETVLHRLSDAARLMADEYLEAQKRLWDEQNAFAERRKALVYAAHKLDFPESALEQQEIMETAWANRARELLCAKARDWLESYGILPEHAGITDYVEHDPDAANEDDPVPCVDFDWLSNEFRCHDIRNFSAVYLRASAWPHQNFMAELRRYHTRNIRRAWERVVDAEIQPLMAMIQEERVYTTPWRELIKQVKAVVAPWSIPRPWPAGRMNRKNATDARSGRCRRFKTSAVQAVTA